MLLKKYTLLLGFISLPLFFISCEKGLDEIDVESIVYITQSGLTEHTVLLGESVFQLGIYKSGVNQKDNPALNLSVDKAAFADFLSSHPGFELLPDRYYSIDNSEVRFAKNDERAFFYIKLKNIDEKFVNTRYILPISIDHAPNVAINEEKSTAFLHFNRYRNFYESKYTLKGGVSKLEDDEIIKKVDQTIQPESISANSLKIPGPENGMSLIVSVLSDRVVVQAAQGSEKFLVQDNGLSNYQGQFDSIYQVYKGNFNLKYSYQVNGVEMLVDVSMKFTL